MVIEILSQNVRGLRTKSFNCFNSLSTSRAHIICPTETWLNENFTSGEFCPQHYRFFRRDRNNDLSGTTMGGGVAIATRSDLIATRLHNFETNVLLIEDAWIKIKLGDSYLYVCNVYISPQAPLDSYIAQFERVRSVIQTIEPNATVLLLGDFNLPEIWWYEENGFMEALIHTRSKKSEFFMDTIDVCGLFQFNGVRNKLNSILDLAICNCQFGEIKILRNQDSIVKEDDYHPTLQIFLNLDVLKFEEREHKKFNFRKANYEAIKNALEQHDWNFINILPLDMAVHKFYEVINNIISQFTPVYTSSRSKPPWFNREIIIKLIQKKNNARRKWLKTNSEYDYDIYSNIRREVKKSITVAHKNYIQFIQDNVQNNVKLFWQYSKLNKKSNTCPNEFKYNDESASDPSTICQMFSNFFQTTYVQSNSQTPIIQSNNVTTNAYVIETPQIEFLLANIDINKNGGPDSIPNIFLRETNTALAPILKLIFNRSLAEGYYPSKFKESFITPIYKKGIRNDICNYRPVSLLNAFSEIFEKLMHDITYNIFKSHLNPNQHGFVRGKSTVTNLSKYTNFIANCLDDGTEVHAIYTDFSKAFDTVDHSILIHKLSTVGICESMLNWFKSYLTNRRTYVAFGGFKSDSFSPPSGVPQGSVLGPLLFNIFINDIGSDFKCNYLSFADDLKVYTAVKSNRDIVNLQHDLNRLNTWCSVNRLVLNTSKCKFLPFSNKLIPSQAHYSINGNTLERVNSMCDLGVIFDSKLKFSNHSDFITRKAYRTLGFIMRLTKHFTNINCITTLYNALVRSSLEYACVIWCPYQKTYMSKIERVQKKFTRYVFFKLHIPNFAYHNRLSQLEMISLEARRLYFDMSALHVIINSNDNTLNNQLRLRNVPYTNRINPLFQPIRNKTNYGQFMNITNRCQSQFIRYFNDIPLLNSSNNTFLNSILRVIRAINI